jgi:hypothetical protein
MRAKHSKVKSEMSAPEAQSRPRPSTRLLDHPIRFRDRIRTFPKKLIAAVLGISTLLGYVVLAPRLSVDPPSAGTDPSNPFNELFTLTNKGNFSLYEVNATCAEPFLGFAPASGAKTFDPKQPFSLKSEMIVPVFSVSKLEPEDPRSFSCNNFSSIRSNGVPIKIVSCAVIVQIDFKVLRFIPWWPTSVPLEAFLREDGKLHWSHPVLARLPPAKPS